MHYRFFSRRANYDGSSPEIFLDRSMRFPEGVALDWLSRVVYWTDPGKRTVEAASMDDPNNMRIVLFDEMIWSPRGITLNPTSG